MKLRKQIIILFLNLISLIPALAATEDQEIRLGVIPEMNVFSQMERFKALGNYLTE
jgi:hypothetical protein